MARKKRRSDDRPERKRPSKKTPEHLPDLPDLRTLGRLLQQFMGELPSSDTPEGQAEELVAQAFEARDPEQRTELARQALALWPDCVDAYVLLAENARTRKESLALYQQAVEAGERALGPEFFEQAVGHFWSILETRPYLRARYGLANSLWTAGRRQEAVQHLQDMLRLNPNDNQGVRYTLAGYLLFLDRDEDLNRLLQQYPEEGSAAWAYTKALLAFRQQGDTPETRRLLQEAIKTNQHVPDYLLGRKHPPDEPPPYYSPGDENEALLYLGGFLASWKFTPGALAWLRAHDEPTQQRQAHTPPARGPLGFIKNWLKKKLPQQADVWQAAAFQMANPIIVEDEKLRPWLVLVVNHSNDLVLALTVLEEQPTAVQLWDTLVQAMQNPAAGEPHRPAELQVQKNEHWESLRSHVEEIGIALMAGEELEHLKRVFLEASEQIVGKPQPGLLDMPGVQPEQVGRFFEAAAGFFEQAPWKQVGYEAAIQIECDRYQGGPWYAVLMGQSGLAVGLALYEDLATLQRMWDRPSNNRENARRSVATTVLFEEEIGLPLSDVQAARQYGWRVARPDAWPWVIHKERGLSHRPPLAWELELLEACLRTIPEFVQRRRQDDPAREEFQLAVASGELKLVLSWMPENP